MSTPIPEWAEKAARDAFEQQIDGMCMTWDHSFGLLDDRQRDYLRRCFRQVGQHDVIPVMARALMAEREAADERAAKIAEKREAILRKQANELFEGRDQGSAILIRERAIEATEIASAIRDRSKT